MTAVTIQLSPEAEQKLREKASLSGKSLEGFVQELAERAAQASVASAPAPKPRTYKEMSPEEWVAAWRAFVDSRPARPVIADDSRESIYEGRGE